MVGRIKDLIEGRSSSDAGAQPSTSRAEPSKPTSSPSSETPAIVPTAQAPRKPAQVGPASGPGESTPPPRSEAPPTPSPSVPLTSRPAESTRPTGPASQAHPQPTRPATAPPQPQASLSQGPRQASGGSAPLSAHTRTGGGGRSGGPLAGHTPHRTGQGGPPPRSGQDQGHQGGSGPRPNPATPPPLRRDDYITPAGTTRSAHPVPGRPGNQRRPASPAPVGWRFFPAGRVRSSTRWPSRSRRSPPPPRQPAPGVRKRRDPRPPRARRKDRT